MAPIQGNYIPAQGWGDANKSFGVFTTPANLASSFTHFQTWLGAPLGQVSAYANGTSWSNLLSNATLYAALGASWPINWSLAYPSDGTATLAQIAAGTWDANFITLARTMLGARPNDTRIPVRIFWEFQFTFPWYAVGNEAVYIAAFQRVTQLFLGVSKKFRFIWCPNITVNVNGANYNPALAYPGDEFVDVIGMDFYYDPVWDGTDPVAAWNSKVTSQYGLNWLVGFASGCGKPIGIPEWGIGADHFGPYVDGMAAWVQANNVAYHNYFNGNNGTGFNDILDSNQYPATGAEFIAKFG